MMGLVRGDGDIWKWLADDTELTFADSNWCSDAQINNLNRKCATWRNQDNCWFTIFCTAPNKRFTICQTGKFIIHTCQILPKAPPSCITPLLIQGPKVKVLVMI